MATITEVLATEHRVFLTVFDQIERALPGLTTLAEVKLLGSLVEGLLERHGETETNLAYAALDHVLEQRGELDRMHQDHSEIDASLKRLHKARDLAEARRLLKTGLKVSREHFRREEETVFPLLERVLNRQSLATLAEAWKHDFNHSPAPVTS